jgi:hypothetical protein
MIISMLLIRILVRVLVRILVRVLVRTLVKVSQGATRPEYRNVPNLDEGRQHFYKRHIRRHHDRNRNTQVLHR